MVKSDPVAARESVDAWEKAYLNQFHNASVGQMFTGILHNLNGVNQAFSLQASLLKSMFSQADDLLCKIATAGPNAMQQEVETLTQLLRQRAIMADQMETKLEQGVNILSRCHSLTALYEIIPKGGITLNRIIQYELDILTANSFFKHRVKKNISLAENIPGIYKFHKEIHNVIYVILLNAIEALDGREHPELSVKSFCENEEIIVEISNDSEQLSEIGDINIFAPFYSTKEGHDGLGLYLANKIIKLLGGSIKFDCSIGVTTFIVSFPSYQVNI